MPATVNASEKFDNRDLTSNIVLSKAPHAVTTFTDVYEGSLTAQLPHGCDAIQLPVAVKCLRYGDMTDEDFKQKKREMLKELAALVCAKHPSILPFLGLYYLQGNMCIVTQWAAMGPLMPFLARNPGADKRAILIQVASALAYLHECTPEKHQIVHGDLHAGNVLVMSDGQAVVCDFGLSKLVPDGHSASISYRPNGLPRGKLAYIAPELHTLGSPRTPASDIFAFGMFMYEVLSDLTPFGDRAGGGGSAVVMILHGDRPERPKEARSYSGALWDLTVDCWAQKPTSRPSSQSAVRRLQDRAGPGTMRLFWNRIM